MDFRRNFVQIHTVSNVLRRGDFIPFPNSTIIRTFKTFAFHLFFIVCCSPTSDTANNGFLVKKEFTINSFRLYPLVLSAVSTWTSHGIVGRSAGCGCGVDEIAHSISIVCSSTIRCGNGGGYRISGSSRWIQLRIQMSHGTCTNVVLLLNIVLVLDLLVAVDRTQSTVFNEHIVEG